MRKLKIISLCLITASLLPYLYGCKTVPDAEYAERLIFAMDTEISIKIPISEPDADTILDSCERLIADIESSISKNASGSSVYLFNQSENGVEFDGTALSVLREALDVAGRTNGAFNPVLGSLSELWNVNERTVPPAAGEITNAAQFCDYTQVKIDGSFVSKPEKGYMLDLGGIGKGYALGKTVSYLRDKIDYGIVSFGGNIGVIGKKPDGSEWKIAIKDPRDADSYIATYTLESGFISVSGDYERYFEYDGRRYHHILDTSTGYPSDSGVMSCAVYCSSAITGDALSTALFVMGRKKAEEFYSSSKYSFEAVISASDGIYTTAGASYTAWEKV